ncbi:uncharacterized protein BT62DRAFT_927124 [Guyanagaster necrorhizus]|uniref:Uncharacterized protein n=1 Tax=Guyanagaster necrorhizus TaxID=856835 RepID=A0A9P7W3B8_9AGAR|nr:uncharacterized protein BT62DRAFT_927124 [Guyanagaster necrorhizus MCA 3950]KAG7451418.1 hypothetical protein BT62DRAFT_927124 [Guyanagaster necrorhizus MCA 3950]
MLRAKDLLDTLPSKWDPRFMLPEDYEEAPKEIEGGFEFDRRITTYGSVAAIFQIFTQKGEFSYRLRHKLSGTFGARGSLKGRTVTSRRIQSKMWARKLNKRLELDCSMTHKRFGKKALPKDLVLKTC